MTLGRDGGKKWVKSRTGKLNCCISVKLFYEYIHKKGKKENAF